MRDYFDPLFDTAGPVIIPSEPLEHAHHRHRQDTVPSTSMTTSSSIISREDGSSRTSTITTTPMLKGPSNPKRPVSYMYEEEDNAASNSCLDCQSLQSSLKRVKLSCSPGELRLQRDLIMLSPHEWQAEGTQPQHQNGDYRTTTTTMWTHIPTRTRLKLIDSLRLYLFLPTDVTVGYNQKQFNHPDDGHPGRNHWRMMIQIPRMFPHRPPVVLRLEGKLWVNRIVISETPPVRSSLSESLLPSLPSSPSIVDTHHMQDDQPKRQFSSSFSSCNRTAGGVSDSGRPYQILDGGKTVVWDKWSPIATLGDVLHVLLSVAKHDRNAAAFSAITDFMKTENRLSSASSLTAISDEGRWMRSSASSDSSFSSILAGDHIDHHHTSKSTVNHEEVSMLYRTTRESYCVEEHKLEDATMTLRQSPTVSKFLTPNRFDVGYEKCSQSDALGFASRQLLRSQKDRDSVDNGMMEIN